MDNVDIEAMVLTLVDMLDEALGALREALALPDLNEGRDSLLATVEALDAELNDLFVNTGSIQSLNGIHGDSDLERA